MEFAIKFVLGLVIMIAIIALVVAGILPGYESSGQAIAGFMPESFGG